MRAHQLRRSERKPLVSGHRRTSRSRRTSRKRNGDRAVFLMFHGALAERNRVRRYGGDESGRALHRDALVIKPQAVETAKLLAIASSTWSAVMTLRHHNAVPAVSINDGRIDRQHTAIGCAKFGHRTRKEVWIVAEHRHSHPPPSATSANDSASSL